MTADEIRQEATKRVEDAHGAANAINTALKDLGISQMSAYMAIRMLDDAHKKNAPDIHEKACRVIQALEDGRSPLDA